MLAGPTDTLTGWPSRISCWSLLPQAAAVRAFKAVDAPASQYIRGIAQLSRLNLIANGLRWLFSIGCKFYVFGNPVDLVNMSICLLYSLNWGNFLRHSHTTSQLSLRRYYHAQHDSGNGAGAFGKPSGHACIVAMFIPTFQLLLLVKMHDFFEEQKWLSIVFASAWIELLFGICFCLFYLAENLTGFYWDLHLAICRLT